jgi:hypothetical protein
MEPRLLLLERDYLSQQGTERVAQIGETLSPSCFPRSNIELPVKLTDKKDTIKQEQPILRHSHRPEYEGTPSNDNNFFYQAIFAKSPRGYRLTKYFLCKMD